MKKRIFLLTVLAGAFTSICIGQVKTKVVELSSETKIYQEASTSSAQVSKDMEAIFMDAFIGKSYPYPFAQPVLEEKSGWLKIPAGWVQKENTQKGGKTPLTDSFFGKAFQGSFGIESKYGQDVAYAVQLLKTNARDNEVAVIIYFPDTQMLARGEMTDNVIKADKGLLIKYADYEESEKDFTFKLHDEKGGIKRYDIYFGERLNSRRVIKIIDDISTIDSFDMKKMNTSDWKTAWDFINKEGMPIKLYITASTLNQLKVVENM